MDNLTEILEQKRLEEKNNPDNPLKICPSCRRWVDKTEARSIFDFNIKICKRCAMHEKEMPKFNWVKETRGY